MCESLIGTLTECAADGGILRRASIERFTRGLAIVAGRWALVGGNGHRADEGDRAEVVVVDLTTMAEVERIGLPCLEVYDIVAVPAPLARGLALGFGANPARAVEQHRAEDRPAATRPTPPEARVRLAPPRVASALSTMGRALDPASVAACGVRGALPARAVAGTATVVAIEVVNRSRRPLASVPPRIVRVAARWIPLPASPSPAPPPLAAPPPLGRRRAGRRAEPPAPGVVLNPAVPLPRLVRPGEKVAVDLPVEVPETPGRYEVRIALSQRGLGWFGVRLQATVDVLPAHVTAARPPAAGRGQVGCSGRRVGNSTTSRIDAVSVSSMTRRSMPMPEPAGGRQAVLQRPQVVLVDGHGLGVAGRLGRGLVLEAAPLLVGVGQLGEGVGQLAAGHDRLEALDRLGHLAVVTRPAARPPWGSRARTPAPTARPRSSSRRPRGSACPAPTSRRARRRTSAAMRRSSSIGMRTSTRTPACSSTRSASVARRHGGVRSTSRPP